MVEISYLYAIDNPVKIPHDMLEMRSYGKAELALLYSPNIAPRSAVKTLI